MRIIRAALSAGTEQGGDDPMQILLEWFKTYIEFPLWEAIGFWGYWVAVGLLLCAILTLYAVVKKICELAKRQIVWLFTGKDPDKGFWSARDDGREYWIEWDRMEKGLPPIESRPIKKKRCPSWRR
jgi:hypothetical protein